jgi:hypothetical protein
MPTASAGTARATATGSAAPRVPRNAEDAARTARAYADSIADGVIARDRAGQAPVAAVTR